MFHQMVLSIFASALQVTGRGNKTVAPFPDGNQLGCHKRNSAVDVAFLLFLKLKRYIPIRIVEIWWWQVPYISLIKLLFSSSCFLSYHVFTAFNALINHRNLIF